MDTSKEYILMCWKAVEIQAGKKAWIYGDVFTDGDVAYVVASKHFPIIGFVWLPRQDQLQEMLWDDEDNIVDNLERLIFGFEAWCRVLKRANDLRDYKSMEQLWLVFAMKELYNKTWNGEDWINA